MICDPRRLRRPLGTVRDRAPEPDDRSSHAVRRTARGAFAACLLGLLAAPAPASTPSPRAPDGRLVVLGFDGADARTIEQMMDRGELPHLTRLRESGTFAPLGTTVPAESPVAWASLNSGQNPAKTGIPGFVKRDLTAGGDAIPALGFFEVGARETSSLDLPFLVRFLVRFDPPVVGGIVAAGTLVLFLVLFLLVLRFRAAVACTVAVVLAVAGGWAGFSASRAVPRSIPDVVGSLLKVGGFWEEAARAGVPCVVLDGPMTWDRPGVEGSRVLSGLGVPDARGSYGDWFVYTTDPTEIAREPEGRSTSTGGTVYRVDDIDRRIESRLFGPRDFESPDRGRLAVPLSVVRREDGTALVSIDGVEHPVTEGDWSPWYHPVFEATAVIKVHAVTRVKVVRMADPFELYVDFLQIDPASPPFWQPVSQPPGFAADLARAIGSTYDTVGWACLTMPMKDREIDPRTFLEDIDETRASREKLLRAVLDRSDWRMLMAVESTPDRVQHMMYQFYDPEHPLYDAEKAGQRVHFGGEEIPLSDAIPAAYRQLDRLVGEVEQHLHPGDTLILCADHGFQSFRRGLNLNNWLHEHGYLVTRELTARRDGGYLQFVDWSQTRAYAVGLGMIFLNLRGRERNGIVEEADAPALLGEIQRELLATRDGENPVVREVYRMPEIHSGPYLDLEGDLMVGLEAGYRVGWSTTTGGIRLEADGEGWKPAPSIEDNTNDWSGDHVSVSHDLVPGAFFCNRKVEIPEGGVDLLHIAPTALAILGVPVPAEYDRQPLVIRD